MHPFLIGYITLSSTLSLALKISAKLSTKALIFMIEYSKWIIIILSI